MPKSAWFPGYEVSNVPSLRESYEEYNTQPNWNVTTEYTLNGDRYGVSDDGVTYRKSGDQWVIDPNMTATLRQIEANVPSAIAQAKSESSGWDFSNVLENLTQLVGVVLQGKTQHDLLQMNLDRARNGLPPINAQQYMPGVNVGVDDGTKKMLIGVAAIGAAALILPALIGGGGRRRR